MNPFQAIILGIVQGLTEFIPVSSSGHLVLLPWLFGWPEPGLAFDTVLHLGTLLAVLIVFWRDFIILAVAWLRSLVQHKADTPQARLAWWVVLGTLPAALLGALLEKHFEALFSAPLYVAVFLGITGLWLVLAERMGRRERQVEDLTWWQTLLVGLAQGLAIAPGISRSGATIGAGMLWGLKREAAARFSFLLAAPIIFGAGLLQLKKLLGVPGLGRELPLLALGFLAAFITGYLCIRFLLGYLKEHRLTVFAAYCWVVGFSTIVIILR
jgi:undecaprenyl-diphosphatase